ncbi:MAG: hypothetical protein KME64_07545 [Scytonematopsis contorta HA4267-MV1]|jgi:hypothetical protein|nr:hypothetical protein [Scytonematopsis contorta HA4267-MV1]
MEKNQAVQNKTSVKKTPSGEAKSSNFKLPGNWSILLNLLERYPWLPVTGLLGLFLGGGTIALYSLGYVGNPQQTQKPKTTIQAHESTEVEVEEPVPVAAQPTQMPAKDSDNPIALWMIAAIALSCGGGCVLILRMLSQQKSQAQRPQKTVNRYQARVSQRRQSTRDTFGSSRMETRSQPQRKPSIFVPPQPRMQNHPVFVPPQVIQSAVMAMPRPRPTVTVLPPETNYQQKKNRQSLAEMMDIRKENPLSSILKKH